MEWDRRTTAGVAKYGAAVALCQRLGVVTPEDPYMVWLDESQCAIVPLFLLYDYSFRPDTVPLAGAVAWVGKAGLRYTDERLLRSDPYQAPGDWYRVRVAQTEPRLMEAAGRHPLVLINHFPLRHERVRLPHSLRFSVWCCTRQTERWHTRFRAKVVAAGHLHLRTTDWTDGVRFEEVSLGYPKHWRKEPGAGWLSPRDSARSRGGAATTWTGALLVRAR